MVETKAKVEFPLFDFLATMTRSTVAIVSIVFWFCVLTGCGPQGPTVFQYPDFHIVGPDKLTVLKTGREVADGNRVADLWIKVDGVDAVHLPDLTLDQLRDWQDRGMIDQNSYKVITHANTVNGERTDTFENGMAAIFEFTDGQLTWLRLDNRDEFKFCSTADGSFSSLPMTREEAISSFGKPQSIRRDKPSAVP